MTQRWKRWIGIATLVAVCLTGQAAFAAARRQNPRDKANAASHKGANDVWYVDFTGVKAGILPAGVTGGGNSGLVTTEVTDIGNGTEKNCLKVVDSDHGATLFSSTATFTIPELTGVVGLQTRFRYTAEGGSRYNSMGLEMQNHVTNTVIGTRVVCSSGNGSFHLQSNGTSTPIGGDPVVSGAWYTLTYVIDYDNQRADARLVNETTGQSNTVTDAAFYASQFVPTLNRIQFITNQYGGTWHFDYLRLYKAERLEEDEFTGVKGVPAEMIKAPASAPVHGKININLDGRYTYTPAAPYEKDGHVMVSVKNLASFFGMSYSRENAVYSMSDGTRTLSFQADGGNLLADGRTIPLSVAADGKGAQLFVPIDDVCAAMGYSCTYQKEDGVVSITRSKGEDGK